MTTIWKYELPITDKQNIIMPISGNILSVQVQHGVPCIWVLVRSDGTEATEERTVEIFGTGHDIPVDMGIERRFIGTFQLQEGSFVGHVFERL